MLLGALLHAGANRKELITDLEKLGIEGLRFDVEETTVSSIHALKVSISSSVNQRLRHLEDINEILDKSEVEDDLCQKASAVFTELAKAEAKVHGISIEKVHFHEVGAVDTIVDIVGTLLCLKQLRIKTIICSPLPLGRGFIQCDHGRLPLPAPAVCQLLEGIPTYGVDIQKELVTPTGAALIKVLSDDYGQMPPMTIKATGYGAGTHTLQNSQPNLLRAIIGQEESIGEAQSIEIIETNLDDWNPEGFGYLAKLLFQRGALDVSLTPVHMKKNRPGFTLQVICTPGHSLLLKQTIFNETSAIGLRFRTEKRITLKRKQIVIQTPYGEMAVKQVETPSGTTLYPEHDECCKAAEAFNVPLKEVYHAVTEYNPKEKQK